MTGTTWVVRGLPVRSPVGAGSERPAGAVVPPPALAAPRPRRRRSSLGGWLMVLADVLVAVAVTVSLVAGDHEPEPVRLCIVGNTNCRAQALDAELARPEATTPVSGGASWVARAVLSAQAGPGLPPLESDRS